MNEDKRIIELTATSELDSTDFLPIDNSKSNSEENSGTRKIRVQTLLDSTLKVMLTQAEYDDLPSSALTDGKVYYITDESKIIINGVVYGAGGETVADVYENGVSVVDPTDKIARIKSYKEVTQAEYDALPSSKLTDDILYCIKDSEVSIVNDVRRNGTSIVNNGVADIAVDSTPTYNSTNLITSGGVSNAINPLQQQIGWLASSIEAELYNDSNTYNVGDYVWQNGSNSTIVLYKCIATTTGSWDSSKWEPVTVTSELETKADKTYVDESIDKQLVHGTASGEIATFSDGSNLPMPSLKVGIEPQQDLHGYDSPWVGGAGKNKCNVTLTTGGRYEVDSQGKIKCVQTIGSATSLVIGTVYLESGETYILSGGVKTDYRLFISVDGVPYASSGSDSDSFTPSTSGSYNVNLVQGVSTQVGDIASPMIRKSTESATFAPYSNICPISGWDEVNVTRTGKNLFDATNLINDRTIDANGDLSGYGGRVETPDYISVKPNTSICLSYSKNVSQNVVFIYALYKDGTLISRAANNPMGTVIQTENANQIRFAFYDSVSKDNLYNIQLEYGSTPTEYTPYTDSHTYTIDLDGTRYGGKLDVVSGVMTVDRVFKTFNGSESWNYYSNVDAFYLEDALENVSSDFVTSETNNVCLCNMYKEMDSIPNSTSLPNRPTGTFCGQIGAFYKRIWIKDTRYTTAEAFETMLSSNNLQIVYPLATPTTIQLTPTQVKSLLGSNNVWADCGEVIEANYIRCLDITINDLISRVEALEG